MEKFQSSLSRSRPCHRASVPTIWMLTSEIFLRLVLHDGSPVPLEGDGRGLVYTTMNTREALLVIVLSWRSRHNIFYYYFFLFFIVIFSLYVLLSPTARISTERRKCPFFFKKNYYSYSWRARTRVGTSRARKRRSPESRRNERRIGTPHRSPSKLGFLGNP